MTEDYQPIVFMIYCILGLIYLIKYHIGITFSSVPSENNNLKLNTSNLPFEKNTPIILDVFNESNLIRSPFKLDTNWDYIEESKLKITERIFFERKISDSNLIDAISTTESSHSDFNEDANKYDDCLKSPKLIAKCDDRPNYPLLQEHIGINNKQDGLSLNGAQVCQPKLKKKKKASKVVVQPKEKQTKYKFINVDNKLSIIEELVVEEHTELNEYCF